MSKQRFTFQEQFSLVIDLNKGLTVEEAKALTDYANAIRKRERERIIKLLYQWQNDLGEWNNVGFMDFIAKAIIQTPCDHNKPCCNGFACSNHIALIKGERSKEEQIADLMWLSEQQLIAENKREGENK